MEHPEQEHTNSEFCRSVQNCCALLRVPVQHAVLLVDPPIKKKPLNTCFLCDRKVRGRLRNIQSSYCYVGGPSVVSLISQCWDLDIKPLDEDGRKIKCCLKCIRGIKRSLSIKKKLIDYMVNVQERVPYYRNKTLRSDRHRLNETPSSHEYRLKQESPENGPSAVYHDVNFEHGYSKDVPEEFQPKNETCMIGTPGQSHQLIQEGTKTKNNSKSKHNAKNASAKFTPTHQTRPVRTPDLAIPGKRHLSSQRTENATKTNINSDHMHSVEMTLEEQAKSLGNQTSQLIKRLSIPRPMNFEERNKLLHILGDRTSNENLVAQTIFRCKSLMETLRACIADDINGTANKLTSKTCEPGPSVLRWMADDDILQHKDLMLKAVLEFKKALPIAFEVLMTLCTPPHIEKRYALPTVAMIYGMAMHTRNKDLSAIQRLNTCVVMRHNPGGELLQIFNKLALTFANSCTIYRLIHKLDKLDMEEAIANVDAEARNDVEGTLSTDQRQEDEEIGHNSNHTDSSKPPKPEKQVVDCDFSFLSDAAESCVRQLLNDKLAKETEGSRKNQRVRRAEKTKRLGTKMGVCLDKDLVSKQPLKKRRTSPRSNIAVSGRKRRQVTLQIRRAAKEKDQLEASQNPDQAEFIGRVIDTYNENGEQSMIEYTIVKNTDVETDDETSEQADVDTSSENGEQSIIEYTIVKNTDVETDGETSEQPDVDTSSENGEDSLLEYTIVKNTDADTEDEAYEQPMCYIPDFHIPDFPVS